MSGLGSSRQGPLGLAIAAFLAVLTPSVVPAQAADEAADPVPSDLEEQVVVRLAEVPILVTDKRGVPITDLTAAELVVREGGDRRRVAFLESSASSDLSARLTTGPVPLTTPSDSAVADPGIPAPIFAAPAPQRRIFLLFDVFNSRTPDRARWVDAARNWVETEMRPTDRVTLAVLERGEVRVVASYTSERPLLLSLLEGGALLTGSVYYDYMLEMRNLLDDLQTCVPAYEPDMCSLSATQAFRHEWRQRSEKTLAALRRFSATLAAIPGRKTVFFMSDGLVVNPGDMAGTAVLATFGTDLLSYNRTLSTLASDVYQDLMRALRVASSADITFFTFDTRHSSMRDASWSAEERVRLHERSVGDPFAAMFDSTRGTLDTMAAHTGGRSFNGPNIEENLARAIRAVEGLYTLGYYRDTRAVGKPKIKVRVDRKGARVSYPGRGGERRRPQLARLELGVTRPQMSAGGPVVPLVLQVPLTDLSYTRQERGFEAGVSLYTEALTPAGERAADVFEMLEVVLTEAEYKDRAERRFSHVVHLALPPGPYRLRVRLSEIDFRRAAERAIDVTVREDGTVIPGIHEGLAAATETGR